MLGFLSGIVYANAGEWMIHKYWLHEEAKKNKESFWRFHWNVHHKNCRQNAFIDADYQNTLFSEWDAQSKEAVALIGASLVHLPLFPFAPGFVAGVWFHAGYYYYVHKRSHLEPEWAKKSLPWHYDHHMGPNQDSNWCVTFPLFDYIMGTREKYLGTEREKEDSLRREKRLKEVKLAEAS
ncbi:MAG: sterol desaturase family protein [Leptospiraceae bacterium]|nr:sterol desaturase family protein [Leptospiraceae bacterium]